jgi:hypothetical protein
MRKIAMLHFKRCRTGHRPVTVEPRTQSPGYQSWSRGSQLPVLIAQVVIPHVKILEHGFARPTSLSEKMMRLL